MGGARSAAGEGVASPQALRLAALEKAARSKPVCLREKKTRSEARRGIFRSKVNPQHPRNRARLTPSWSGEFEQSDNQGDDAPTLNP